MGYLVLYIDPLLYNCLFYVDWFCTTISFSMIKSIGLVLWPSSYMIVDITMISQFPSPHLSAVFAQLAGGAVEYTDCISAKG